MEEKPCPWRIPFDSGVAFSLGTVLGSTWNSIKGFREYPQRRLYGIKRLVRKNAPRLGGNFAAWGTLFSCSECSLVALRGTDDSYNRIAAGAFTSGALALRGGSGAIMRGALIGGTLLGLIEGVSYVLTRAMSPDMSLYASEEEQQAQREAYERHLRQQQEKEAREREAFETVNVSKPSTTTNEMETMDSYNDELDSSFTDHGVEMTTESVETQKPSQSSGGGFFSRRKW